MPGWVIGYNDVRGMKSKAITAPPKTDDSEERGIRKKEIGELRKQGIKAVNRQGIRGLEAASICREPMRQRET